MRDVFVCGVGLTPFGRHVDHSLRDLASDAVRNTLADAGLAPADVDAVYFSNAAAGLITGQEMIRGQVALRGSGVEDRLVANVENACASGSTAAHLAWQSVASGESDVVLAVGAEKLFHADKARSFAAIEAGTDLSLEMDVAVDGGSFMMGAYAAECRAYAKVHPRADVEAALARIAVKNRAHAASNPFAQYREPITVDDVKSSRLVADPLRVLTCSPVTDGSCAIALSASPPSGHPGVRIAASAVRSFMDDLPVIPRAVAAAEALAGSPSSAMDLFAMHDACAFAELLQYEQAGLVAPGDAADALADGTFDVGGRYPVNTDGGLLSRGHALGATGLAQLAELTIQLRQNAGARQVRGAKAAMAINAGGWMGEDYAAAVVTVLATA